MARLEVHQPRKLTERGSELARVLRQMEARDLDEVGRVWRTAFSALQATRGEAAHVPTEGEIARTSARFRHLLSTDPHGSFVAEDEGEIVGLAASLLRGRTFVLSNLGVAPDHQDRGVGQALLEAALAYGAAADFGLIFSSDDPRAFHRYLSAGFGLAPAMTATGRDGRDLGATSMRRSGGCPRDLELVAELDREVRGAARTNDLECLLGGGADLYLDEHGAYAIVRDEQLLGLAAADVATAKRVLAELLTGAATGRALTASYLTAADPWAFAAVAEAHASLAAHGAVMTRGPRPYRGPYLPNWAFG